MTKRITYLAAATLCSLPGSAAAQGYRAERVTAAPPQEIAAPVRALLTDQAIRVSGPGGTYAELWFRGEIPAKASPGQTLGVAYPRLVEGALVGAIRFAGRVNDFRNRTIQPGVYTLRYGLHPVDGNHMGVAPHRDFLLISPAGEDGSDQARPFDDLVAQSRKASGTTHPSIWSLMPPEARPAALPAMVEYADEGFWLLYTTITIRPEGAAPAEIPLVLVVVGHAPEA